YIHAFFFFQAEDGIRDFHVTGVQTCALPISTACTMPSTSAAMKAPASEPNPPITTTTKESMSTSELMEGESERKGAATTPASPRSEERRVGKQKTRDGRPNSREKAYRLDSEA